LEGRDELIALNDQAYANVQMIFTTIMSKYCGNMREQCQLFTSQLTDLRHQLALKDEQCKRIIAEKDIEIYLMQIKLLEMELQIANCD
jgi:hypothetical protein